MSSYKRLAPAAIPALAVFLLYYGTFNYPIQFDGIPGVKFNSSIRDITNIQAIWAYNPSRFLVFFSFAINYAISGLDTFSYHLLNTLVHAINAILVYCLCFFMFRAWERFSGSKAGGTAAMLYSLAAAMIFSLHPLQTQAVTYIWQRSTSIGAMFYLASMLFYLISALEEEKDAGHNRWKEFMALSLFSGFLAMFSKQFSVTLPVAIALLDFFLVSRTSSEFKKRSARLSWFIPLLLVVPLMTVMFPKGEVGDIISRSENILSPGQYLMTQFGVHVLYLKLFIWPSGQNLDYDYPPVESFAGAVAPLIFLLAILALAGWLFRANRIASFGIVFYFLAHSVESSFFPLEDLVFEHRNYLPSAGLFIAIASIARQVAQRFGSRGEAVVAALLITASLPCAAASWNRNQAWATEESLWKDVIEKSPGKWRGYLRLGVVMKEKGNYNEALPLYEQMVSLKPEIEEGHHDLGVLKRLTGDLDGAEASLKKALSIEPRMGISAYELGKIYSLKGDYNKAGENLTLAINTRPGLIPAYHELGKILMQKGDFGSAEMVYQRALTIRPSDKISEEGLAKARKAAMGQAQPPDK